MGSYVTAAESDDVYQPRPRDPVAPAPNQEASVLSSLLARKQIEQNILHKSKGRPHNPKGRFWSYKRRNLIILGILLLVVVAVICAAVDTVLHRRRSHSPKPTPHATGPIPFREAFQANFPDPSIIQHNGTWYAFGTNNAAGILHQPFNETVQDYGKANLQLATSTDFVNWTLHSYPTDPLPELGDWVALGSRNVTESNTTGPRNSPESIVNVTTGLPLANVWAPDILQRPSDGKFVLYYSATASNATEAHCIGAAVADTPQGPFEPLPTPLACPTHRGGAIDPTPFVDVDGKIYVAYKIDGNSHGHGGICGNMVPPRVDTPILLQQLADDATTPIGSPLDILDRIESDGPLVEAPSLARTDEGVYFLFFSSGCTRMPSYDLKYATSTNVTGPYVRGSSPLLVTGDWGLLAPGSGSVRKDGEQWVVAFHSRITTPLGAVRAMHTAALTLNGTKAAFE